MNRHAVCAIVLAGVLTATAGQAQTPPAAGVPDLRDPLPRVTFSPPAPDTPVRPVPLPKPMARKRTGRALLEAGTFIMLSAANYWRTYSTFTEDWQFGASWKDQRRKFFSHDGLRLDSNNMGLNWRHAGSGAAYYSWARTNGLSAGNAFLFSTAGSVLWEYLGEWREISSINDHIFTSTGGLTIGEPTFQFANYFRNRPGFANRLAEFLANPVLAINDLLDGRQRAERVPADDWHDFRLSVGARSGARTDDSAATQGSANLDLRLVTLRDYGKPGTARGYSRTTMDVGLHADVNTLGSDVAEFNIATRATLFGWWRREIREEATRRRGYDLWYGVEAAWDIFQKKPVVPYDGDDLGMKMRWFPREMPTQYADKLSSAHLPGPAFSLTRYDGRWRTRLDLGANLDFSMVNALALNAYSADHDIWGVKTTLHNWGFYYALGPRVTGRIETEYGILRATAGVDFRHFSSIQGGDRFQHDLIDDTPVRDSRLVASASLTARLPKAPVFSTLSVERIDRRGHYHDTSVHTVETRVSFLAGVTF